MNADERRARKKRTYETVNLLRVEFDDNVFFLRPTIYLYGSPEIVL